MINQTPPSKVQTPERTAPEQSTSSPFSQVILPPAGQVAGPASSLIKMLMRAAGKEAELVHTQQAEKVPLTRSQQILKEDLEKQANKLNEGNRLRSAAGRKAGKFADETLQGVQQGQKQGPYAYTNFNLDKLEDPGQVNLWIQESAKHLWPQMWTAKRGKQSWKATEEKAKKLLDEEGVDVLKWGPGMAVNDATIEATKMLLAQARNQVEKYGAAILAGDNSTITQAKYITALQRQGAILTQLSGMAGEAGRALNTLRKVTQAYGDPKLLEEMLTEYGSSKDIAQLARDYMRLAPKEKNKLAKNSIYPGFADMVREHWYGMVLMGPATHAANVIGNTGMLGERVLDRAIAAQWGRLFGFMGAERGVMPGEARVMAMSYLKSMPDAFKLFLYALTRGEQAGPATNYKAPITMQELLTSMKRIEGATVESGNKVPHMRPQITKSNVEHLFRTAKQRLGMREDIGRGIEFLSTAAGVWGATIRSTGRLLGAEDELFKALLFRSELEAITHREAMKRGLSGDNYAKFVADFTDSPPEQAFQQAMNVAQEGTFTKPLGLGSDIFTSASRAMEALSHGYFTVANKRAIPLYPLIAFVRVTGNIMKTAGSYTFAPADEAVHTIMGESRVFGKDPVARDMELAKLTVSGMIWSSMLYAGMQEFDLAKDNGLVITPSEPPNPGVARIWRARGFNPYSIAYVENGNIKWQVELKRIEPFGTMLGLAADFYNLAPYIEEGDLEDAGKAMLLAISNVAINKTWMQGVSKFLDALRHGTMNSMQRFMDTYFGGYYKNNLLKQIADQMDPYMRKTKTMMDSFWLQSAEARKKLPPLRDLWGYPIENKYLADIRFTGIRATGPKQRDPVADELFRLEIPFGKPDAKIQGVELDDYQYDRYQELFGHAVKPQEDHLVELAAFYRDDKGEQQFSHSIVNLKGLNLHDALEQIITNPVYKHMTDGIDPPGSRASVIRKVRNYYLDLAQAAMLQEYPDLLDSVRNRMAEQRMGQAPDTIVEQEIDNHMRYRYLERKIAIGAHQQ